jgi:adenylosuccinate synthase
LGVHRTYATRHGQGPFPTAAPTLNTTLPERHNKSDGWQGDFRRGWLDLVLLRYAIRVSGRLDGLVVTHLDALDRLPIWRVCEGYRVLSDCALGREGDAIEELPNADGESLTELLTHVAPRYISMPGRANDAEGFVGWLGEVVGVEPAIGFSGPCSTDGTFRG